MVFVLRLLGEIFQNCLKGVFFKVSKTHSHTVIIYNCRYFQEVCITIILQYSIKVG